MTTRKEKISREIDNFVGALEKGGYSDLAKAFLKIEKPKCISGEIPLCYHLANTHDYLDKFGIAIASGADPNLQNITGNATLHALAFYGAKDQIELLLSTSSVDVNLRNLAGHTPLDLANARSQDSVISLLKKRGAIEGMGLKDPNRDLNPENQARLAEYDTLLQKATKENYTEAKNFLNIFKSIPDKIWPLHAIVAYPRQNIEIAKWMIDNGANFNSRDPEGKTPLHHAASLSIAQMVQELCQNAAEINTQDNNGFTPLHWAASRQKKVLGGREKATMQDAVKLNIIKTLLDSGADPKVVSKNGRTPMDLLDPKLKTEIEEYLAEIASKKAPSIDDSSLIEGRDESQDLEKILDEALRELEGEGV